MIDGVGVKVSVFVGLGVEVGRIVGLGVEVLGICVLVGMDGAESIGNGIWVEVFNGVLVGVLYVVIASVASAIVIDVFALVFRSSLSASVGTITNKAEQRKQNAVTKPTPNHEIAPFVLLLF